MASDASEQTAQILWTPTQRQGASSTTRRVSVACAFCRARKVKCNRLDDQPCTNCVFENVQCMLLPKQRRQRQGRHAVKPTRSAASEDAVLNLATLDAGSTNLPDIQTQPGPPPFDKSPIQQRLEREKSSEDSAPANGDMHFSQDINNDTDNDIDWREAAVEAVPVRPPNPSMSPSHNTPSLGGGREVLASSLPSFLKPPPSCLGEEDLVYLGSKGALSIPEPELRDALIESYVYYVHPCYPILDLATLEEAMLGNGTQTFSLSVFQAIMFAGSGWVDVKLLRNLGYLSRWAARKAFYSKARLLYDTDYEQDRMCQLQTLVLLSLWWKAPNEPKDGWHWLGLAISLARTLGLHRDATNKQFDPKTSALRRRLWWSCITRDTFTSFSSNRVPRISDTDYVVAPLTLQDFELHEQGDAARWRIRKQSLDVQKQLATICIQTAAICKIITRVLLAAYNETSTGYVDIIYSNSTPDQGRSYIEPVRLRNLEEEFQAWQAGVSPDILHPNPISVPLSRHKQAPLVHRALLSILSHTGLIMIQRQRDSSLPPSKTPRDLVRNAARQVNKIIMDMYAVDLMKDMAPTVISLLFPVSMSHLLDMKSREPYLRREGRRRLEECKQALRELADGHVSAEWAVNLLKYAESKIKIHPDGIKVLSTSVASQTPSYPEEPLSYGQDTDGQRHDQQRVQVSAQVPPTTFLGGEYASTSHLRSTQTGFMPDFGDPMMTENPLDWDDPNNMWLGFPEIQWDIATMDRLEHGTMSTDFEGGTFRL